jgi:leader peptidase (prepilin peptidase) / N-methyltransferase
METGNIVEVMQSSMTPWFVFFSVIAFFFGACMGSFLNVCIYRIPLEIPVYRPKRSFCPHCKQQIAWYHNIPLLSWLMLRGKCRYCGAGISYRYLVVELITALLFLLVWLKYDLLATGPVLGLVQFSDWWLIPVYWLVVFGLVLGTFVDFEHMIIPDRVTLGGIVAGLVLSALVPSLHGETTVLRSLLWSSIGAIVGGGTLWLTAIIGRMIFKKEAMGFGDVKLLGAVGAFFGSRAILFTILVSSLAGSIVGVSLVASRNRDMQSKIPYGPYLALAALVWLFWGPALWEAYLDLFRPDPAYIMP